MQGHTVLLVDRDLQGRSSLAQRLRDRGCALVEAGGLVEAQEIAAQRAVHVALVDLQSLRDEGVAVVRALRHLRPACEVIVLAQRNDIGLVIQAMRLGAFDDQIHPIDVDLLLDKIRQALEAVESHRRAPAPRVSADRSGENERGRSRKSPRR